MKRMMIVAFVALTILTANVAFASCYTCNVLVTSPDYARFTATNGAFTNKRFSLPTTVSTRNQYLAVLLSAITSGKTVNMCVNSSADLAPLTSIQLLP